MCHMTKVIGAGRVLFYVPSHGFHAGRGGDEWHNKSFHVGVPGISVAVFYGRGFSRKGPEHVSSWVGGEPSDPSEIFDIGCEDCNEMHAFIQERQPLPEVEG